MGNALRFFFSRVLAGLVLLFPIAVTVLVISQLLEILEGLNAALAAVIPQESAGKVSVIAVVSVVTVLLVLFVLGLLIAPRQQGKSNPLERRFLNYLPGYSLIRGVILGAFGQAGKKSPRAGILRRFEGVEELVVILSRFADGRCVVFLPNAPTPSAGSLLVVAGERVEPIEASLLNTLSVYADWGLGAEEVFSARGGG